MNEVMLFGKLAQEPQLRESKNGNKYMFNSVCVKKKFKPKTDPTRNQYDYINFTAFGGVAQTLADHAHKGTYVTVRGALSSSKKKKGNVEYYATEFIAEIVEIAFGTGEIDSKPAEEQAALPYFEDVDVSAIDPETLPF